MGFVGKRAELHGKQFNICKLIKVGSIYQRKSTRKTEGHRWLSGRGPGYEQTSLGRKSSCAIQNAQRWHRDLRLTRP